MQNQETKEPNKNLDNNNQKEKKKLTLSEFKVKSFVTDVKVEQMQFLKTAGG